MREFMKQHADLLQKQREARAIWWDKTPRELAEERRMDQGRVAQSPYVYSDSSHQPAKGRASP
jgi:hypothetical protein